MVNTLYGVMESIGFSENSARADAISSLGITREIRYVLFVLVYK